MKKRCVVLILSLCLLVPGMALAAGLNAYGALKLGYFLPNDDNDGMDDFDSTFSIGLAAGAKLNPNIAFELGWDYYSSDADSDFDVTVATWSIPVTCMFIVPAAKDIDVFVGLGVGMYNSEIEWDSIAGDDSESDSGFGYHFLAGADFKIDRNVALGAEIKWCKAELDFDSDDDFNVGGTTVSLVAKYLF